MTNLTESPTFTPLVPVPDPGEGVKAATPPGAVRPGYQAVTNRTAMLMPLTIATPLCRRARIYGIDGTTTITIYDLGAFTATDTGVYESRLPGYLVVDADAVCFATTGSHLAPNTRYFLYLALDGATFEVAINTDYPHNSFVWKNGPDTTLAYVTTFITDPTASPNSKVVGFIQTGTEYWYTCGGDPITPTNTFLRVVNNGHPTAITDVDCTYRIPDFAVTGTFYMFEASPVDLVTLSYYVSGTSKAFFDYQWVSSPARNTRQLTIPSGAFNTPGTGSFKFRYKFDVDPTAGNGLTAYVQGFKY